MIRRRRRRIFGRILVAYGVLGLLLVAGSLLLIVRPLAAMGSLADHRSDVIRWLDVSSADLREVERGLSTASASLSTAAVSARSAAQLSHDLSGAMAALRDASGVSILGAQPLAGVTDDLDRVAGRADALAGDMSALAVSLDADTADLSSVAADAAVLRGQVEDLRDVLAGPAAAGLDAGGPWLLAWLILATAWWAVPAAASLAVGAAWLRPASASRSSRTPMFAAAATPRRHDR